MNLQLYKDTHALDRKDKYKKLYKNSAGHEWLFFRQQFFVAIFNCQRFLINLSGADGT